MTNPSRFWVWLYSTLTRITDWIYLERLGGRQAIKNLMHAIQEQSGYRVTFPVAQDKRRMN